VIHRARWLGLTKRSAGVSPASFSSKPGNPGGTPATTLEDRAPRPQEVATRSFIFAFFAPFAFQSLQREAATDAKAQQEKWNWGLFHCLRIRDG